MRLSTLPDLDTSPIVVEPTTGQQSSVGALIDWVLSERHEIDEMLHRSGAILFRGFEIEGAASLAQAAVSLGGPLQNYVGGDSPRSKAGDKVYNSTEFPPHLPIELHNELSYAGWWPTRIFFCCDIAPETGGQTPIGNSRAIYNALPADLRSRFETRGVRYIQTMHKGVGPQKSWQETFETEDPAIVEAYCKQHGMDYRWTDYGLKTSIRRQAVITHPVTGEKAWFNQAEHWHAAVKGIRFWDADAAAVDEDRLPAHCTYGDGEPITRSDLETILATTKAAERTFDWQRNDLLMLDNLITAHGRRPFTGARRILVAMA